MGAKKRSVKQPKRPVAAKRARSAKPKRSPAAKPNRSPAAKPKAMFEKVAFTMFSVEDATRARAFYEDVLGLQRGLASPGGEWTEYDLPGGGCLALFCFPRMVPHSPGSASVAFEVADLDALNERLAAAGVQYQGDMAYGPNCRMSNILDSEGNRLILHELSSKKKR